MKKGKQIADINMKLLGAAGALFASMVLLVMSTLAWFTVANAPMASKVAVGVNGSKNFEIAKAITGADGEIKEVTANDSTYGENAWGETVTFSETESAGITVELPITIGDDGKIQTVSFNETGRTNGLTDVSTNTTGMSNGIDYYTYTVDNVSKKCAVILGIWLRTNTSGDIYAQMEGLSVTGGNGSSSDDVAKMIGVGICINPKGGGQFYKMSSTSEEKVGSLTASSEGTYAEIIVYLDGDNVVAYDVGGASITVNIESIKFRNSSVETTTS